MIHLRIIRQQSLLTTNILGVPAVAQRDEWLLWSARTWFDPGLGTPYAVGEHPPKKRLILCFFSLYCFALFSELFAVREAVAS